jgi:secretion/DNA translocation related TadE-like protein
VREQEGFVTLAVVGLAAVLVATGGLVATLGAVAVARHRAASAADLSALAGARHVLDGTACDVAQSVARAQSAVLTGCAVAGSEVTVVAAVKVPGLGTAQARATAGPVGARTAGNHLAL